MGRKMLLEVLQRTRARFVAATCRVSAAAVSQWASGATTPSQRARVVLEERYRIPRAAWN